jgi:hypothetical protein
VFLLLLKKLTVTSIVLLIPPQRAGGSGQYLIRSKKREDVDSDYLFVDAQTPKGKFGKGKIN